jgi:predicted transcriptional regulator of viral defense system
VLWAKADDGPQNVALSHATALAVYGISDANPAFIHITIPRNARLRRARPKWVEIHHADLQTGDVMVQEGLPITTVGRTVQDMLSSTGQVGWYAKRYLTLGGEGYIDSAEAQRLKRRINSYVHTRRGGDASVVASNADLLWVVRACPEASLASSGVLARLGLFLRSRRPVVRIPLGAPPR